MSTIGRVNNEWGRAFFFIDLIIAVDISFHLCYTYPVMIPNINNAATNISHERIDKPMLFLYNLTDRITALSLAEIKWIDKA